MSLRKNFQPLYRQVQDLLTQRLIEGFWKPGAALPSELALAEELGVSHGTVRKALNEMVARNLLRRRQGRGTYVSEHTQESSLFRFFRLRHPDGEDRVPHTRVLRSRRRAGPITKRSSDMLYALAVRSGLRLGNQRRQKRPQSSPSPQIRASG